MKRILPISLILTLFLVIGCTQSEDVPSDLEVTNLTLVSDLAEIANKNYGNSKKMRPPIYGDCVVYTGIVNDKATFKPESDPFDELYALGDGLFFKDGVPLISESKPGDQDYNGGRWHVNVLTDPANAGKYSDACSVEHLDLADFSPTGNYFSCPMLPRK
jgi:hypothetical protein